MSLFLLSPLAGLLAVAAAVPLGALLVTEARSRRLRESVGLSGPSLLRRLPGALAICAFAALLALAAAQPVVVRGQTRYARADAQAFFVFDTSRSMLAARSPSAPTRFARARDAARLVRAAVPDVPVGIASLTDRVLPDLFPTMSAEAFAATLDRALGIERPPPDVTSTSRVTTFAALSALQKLNFFSPAARRRLAIVFSDGESRPVALTALRRHLLAAPGVKTLFVRFWDGDERVFSRSGAPEAGYRPDPASGELLAGLAAEIGGRVYSEGELGRAASAARDFLGRGPRVAQGRERRSLALAPYAVGAAFLPLSFLLWRRNL